MKHITDHLRFQLKKEQKKTKVAVVCVCVPTLPTAAISLTPTENKTIQQDKSVLSVKSFFYIALQ